MNCTWFSTFSHSLPFFSVVALSSRGTSSAQVTAMWIFCDGFFSSVKQILVGKHCKITHTHQRRILSSVKNMDYKKIRLPYENAKGQIQCSAGQENLMDRSIDAGEGNSRGMPMKK